MSAVNTPSVFIYVIDRDYGFAPNPFHGYCTLATCKPGIRKSAQLGDWVVGVGGSRLHGFGHCIYAMKVTQKTTFNDYWTSPEYIDKKPVRNGSSVSMAGDNIYYNCPDTKQWLQADSHHSNKDGSINESNLKTDTSKTDAVLISEHFYYFGKDAPSIPEAIRRSMGLSKNPRSYLRQQNNECDLFIDWIKRTYKANLNQVSGDPFDFDNVHQRYDAKSNKVG